MLRQATFAILLLAVVLPSATEAQIGRGRLLRKLQNDLFGNPQQTQQQKQQKQQQQKALAEKQRLEAQKRAQLEAQRRAQYNSQRRPQTGQRQPTPIQTGQVRPNTAPTQRTQQGNYQRQVATPSRTEQKRFLQPPSANQNSRTSSKSTSKPAKRIGFGIRLAEKGDKLYVAEVAPKGNGAEAGLKRGDQIIGIGGVDVETEKAFDEIAEILNDGDNIEIAFRRNGRVDEIQVAYGEFAAEDVEGEISTENNSSSNANYDANQREIERLNGVIREQQKVISDLKLQLQDIQSQTTSNLSSREPIGTSSRSTVGQSVLQGPSLNSPGQQQ